MKNREAYTGYVVYEDEKGKSVGFVSARARTIAGFNASITGILGNADLATAMGDDAVRDSGSENYPVALKCHEANGEVYVTLSRVPGSGSPRTPTTPSGPGSRPGPTPSRHLRDSDGERDPDYGDVPRDAPARLCRYPRSRGHVEPGP